MTRISVQYYRVNQTVTCTSSGGPATNVTWYKDNVEINMISSERGIYENSQIILDTINATYENRLRIVDKSSEATGTYTCEVKNPRGSMNGSLYIQGKSQNLMVYTCARIKIHDESHVYSN